jgi:2-polyprenyl-3-methyl-5-hydroxy-6-metoxy-1,4-benzoquinol methylase
MTSDARDYVEANRRHWDEVARLHPSTAFYQFLLDRLRSGGTSLHRIEIEDVGDVAGKTLLHLQCHIGTESVSWARRGAHVTAVDFSANGIDEARRIADEMRVDVRFAHANIYELAGVVDDVFDVVYTSWGVLSWLPDLVTWARVVAHHLKTSGVFYIAEFHPTPWIFDEFADDLRVKYSYFPNAEPVMDETPYSYADPDSSLTNRRTYNWPYPLSHVVTSLIDAGLRIEFLHELPRCVYPMLPILVRDNADDERWYRMPDGAPKLPLAFTLRARRD